MASMSTRDHGNRTRRINISSPPYLISSRQCRECKQSGHATKHCPGRQKGVNVTEMEGHSHVSTLQVKDPRQIFRESFQNNSFTQTHLAGMSPYLTIDTSLPPLSTNYIDNGAFGLEKPLTVPDLDFPSLSGSSLDNSLLNSPLEINSDNPLPSLFPTQSPFEQGPSHSTRKRSTEKNNSYCAGHTSPTVTRMSIPRSKNLPAASDGFSHYDEATWSDQFEDSVTSNNVTQPWYEEFSWV